MNILGLDKIDRRIMEILQQDARTPIKDIAKEVFLTSPAVSARINRLVEEGYIVGFHAEINPKKLGYHIKAFINLEVQPEDKSEFYPYIEKCPNVIECNCVTGDYSMILEVQFPLLPTWISSLENCRSLAERNIDSCFLPMWSTEGSGCRSKQLKKFIRWRRETLRV